MCKNLRFNFVKQGRCSLKDKKSKPTEIQYEAPFLAGFIYFFDRMMPPYERRLSSAELSFQKLHLISTFSLWSILGSVEDLWKSDSAVPRKSITSGTMAKKNGAAFFWFIREYTVYIKRMQTRSGSWGGWGQEEAGVQPDEAYREQWLSSLVQIRRWHSWML